MDERLERNLVREGLALAPMDKRVKAFIVDELVISLLVFVAFWDRIASATTVTQSLESLNEVVLWILVLKIAYHAIFVTLYGATLGKLWQKIYVITIDDLAKPPFMAALARGSMRAISEWLFYVGFIWAWINPNRQTWQDKIGRTIVVQP
jgi:uncharacterized RDD family membrane protein YckC